MVRLMGSAIIAVWAAAGASGQFPGSTPILPPQVAPNPSAPLPPTVLQNYYNRSYQPLSPYLNLVRGTGQFGIDYYFSVRPGLPSGGQPLNQQVPRGMALSQSQMKLGYIPQAGVQTSEPQPLPDPNQDLVLPPSGHSVAYGNVFGINRGAAPGGGNTAAGRGGFFTAPSYGSRPRPTAPTTRK